MQVLRLFCKIINNNQNVMGAFVMYQTERMDEILRILKKYHYVTVDYLVEKIRYSPASIRRDLTLLEKQGLVKRSYGGVEIKADLSTPFKFRQHSMKSAKNSIASCAAELVKDNDTVFIDGSSSAQYLGHFLTNKKGITVITNNMLLASQLKESGINTYCTGGYVSELPGILAGEITNNTFSMFHADIMFFATSGTNNGVIYGGSEVYFQHHRIMLQNSDKCVYLCGSDKIGKTQKVICATLDDVDYFISDVEMPEDIVNKYKNTKFINAKP